MSRIIIDVTQLVHWSGKLTGIPRVMYELAVRFSREKNEDIVFATWVKDIQEMCEVDFSATMAVRGNGIVYRKKGEPWPPQAPLSARAAAAPAAVSADGKRPVTVKRIVKYGLRKAKRVAPGLAGKLEQQGKQLVLNSYHRVELGAGDTLFIPWGEWWDPNFIQLLKDWHANGMNLAPVIHDIGPMVAPQFSGHSTDSLADYTRNIVPIAELTLVVSNNTKKDLISWLAAQNLQAPRIEVFRLGEDFEFSSKPKKPVDPLFTKSGLKGNDYIMCMGTVELKKNHMLLYYVYKLAKQRGITLPKLLIVGRRGWKTETVLDLIATDTEVNQDILALHDISDEELVWLYDHCKFTVLPSIYEGWGIPVAESLAHGVPCVCSNTSSMVEIAPGITQHFSPYSTDECLAAIQRLLDPKEYKAAQARAKQFKQTSWDDSYKQVKMYLETL
ncbi:MAG TPA: glycosyltransferase family 1 protein [Candidatus Saccharimonadales bacterium]|nr:glycosyltransferase family 1 protein [Candidatus Saccharimonadales bacterium]